MLAPISPLVLSAVLVSSLLAAGAAVGLTQSVDVVVLVDPSYAARGATVTVTVEVFDRSVLTEPSAITAILDTLPGITPLPLTRDSVGVFRGEFVFDRHPTVVRVNATVGLVQDEEAGVVYDARSSVFVDDYPSVSIVPSRGTVRPGEIVSVAVEVRGRDGLEDPDRLEITVDIFYAPGFERQSGPVPLTWTRTAVGKYAATYMVPRSIDRDAFVEFRGTVILGDGSGLGLGARTYLDFPDLFTVWYRTLSIGPSNGTLEVDVASTGGIPLSEANVAMRTVPALGEARSFEGTTDSSGAVRFEIPLNGSILPDFYGNVTYGNQRQGFYGSLRFPRLLQGPELVRENSDEIVEAGGTAVLRFSLVSGDAPIPDQELYVYAHTSSQIVLAQSVSTDRTGRFVVTFVAPPDPVQFEVSGEIEGTWRYFDGYFVATHRLAAVVWSPDGWHLTISGGFPNQEGPWVGHLDLSTKSGAGSVPGPWTAGGSFSAYRVFGGSSGEAFALDVPLPRFLPAGQEVAVWMYAESFGGQRGSAYYEFRGTVVAGTPIPRPVDVGVLMVLLAMGLLVAVPFMASLRRRPPRPEPPQRTGTGPPPP